MPRSSTRKASSRRSPSASTRWGHSRAADPASPREPRRISKVGACLVETRQDGFAPASWFDKPTCNVEGLRHWNRKRSAGFDQWKKQWLDQKRKWEVHDVDPTTSEQIAWLQIQQVRKKNCSPFPKENYRKDWTWKAKRCGDGKWAIDGRVG